MNIKEWLRNTRKLHSTYICLQVTKRDSSSPTSFGSLGGVISETPARQPPLPWVWLQVLGSGDIQYLAARRFEYSLLRSFSRISRWNVWPPRTPSQMCCRISGGIISRKVWGFEPGSFPQMIFGDDGRVNGSRPKKSRASGGGPYSDWSHRRRLGLIFMKRAVSHLWWNDIGSMTLTIRALDVKKLSLFRGHE
jgi:hypothetical protein